MSETKDGVDITPTAISGMKQRKQSTLQEKEMMHVRDNPARLTKEGVEKKIELWGKESRNYQVLNKYRAMLNMCKNLEKSGKDKLGRTVLSRDENGNPVWVDGPEPVQEEKAETKEKESEKTNSEKQK